MKFAPFKPCTLPKHVRVEILHREFPVKNLYFPCKGLQCRYLMPYPCSHFYFDIKFGDRLYSKEKRRAWTHLF